MDTARLRTGAGGDTVFQRSVKCCPECAQHYSHESMFCPFDGTMLEDVLWVAPTDPTVDPLLTSVVDSRYRVDRVLGEGGTGTVYEVTHLQLERTFAMKVLRRDVARDHGLSTRFIQEAKATASLKHPHIVSITDFGHLPDRTPYFIMERLVGRTLAEAVHEDGQLRVDRAIQIVMQIADALATAHEAGIVHRDLKPENVFLVGGDDVRIVDFGAAKIAGATRITKTGIVFGTPHYMSPEQASGQPVDHRADIYALGVIMYELWTGKLPFLADSLMGVLTKHMFVDPLPFDVQAGRGSLMDALESVTMRALAKKPEERFQTMGALAAELARMVSFEESGAVSLAPGWTPPPPPQRTPPPISRRGESQVRPPVYPSEDVPALPGTSLRGPLLGLCALTAAAGIALLVVRRSSVAAEPPAPSASANASASATASQSPTPSAPPVAPAPSAAAVVHVTSVPAFAEVWRNGQRFGTTPVDLPLDVPGPWALRAPGFRERALTLGSDPSLAVTLDALAPAPPSPPPAAPHPSAKPPPKHAKSDGELVDPFQ